MSYGMLGLSSIQGTILYLALKVSDGVSYREKCHMRISRRPISMNWVINSWYWRIVSNATCTNTLQVGLQSVCNDFIVAAILEENDVTSCLT